MSFLKLSHLQLGTPQLQNLQARLCRSLPFWVVRLLLLSHILEILEVSSEEVLSQKLRQMPSQTIETYELETREGPGLRVLVPCVARRVGLWKEQHHVCCHGSGVIIAMGDIHTTPLERKLAGEQAAWSGMFLLDNRSN